jgi:hypothetical protein
MSQPPMFWRMDDSSSVVAQMYVQRQRDFFAIGNGVTTDTPLCLRVSAATPPDPKPVDTRAASADVRPVEESPQPPKRAELLLIFCAKTPSAAEGILGDMYELFRRDCAKRGPARARLFYWGHTASFLWPLLRRALGRAATWAAIVSTVKRLLIG